MVHIQYFRHSAENLLSLLWSSFLYYVFWWFFDNYSLCRHNLNHLQECSKVFLSIWASWKCRHWCYWINCIINKRESCNFATLSFVVLPGIEPGLSWFRVRCVANYTTGQNQIFYFKLVDLPRLELGLFWIKIRCVAITPQVNLICLFIRQLQK